MRVDGLLRVWLVNSVLLVTSAFAGSFGNVSFTPPAGWKYEQTPGGDFASMTLVSGQRYCVLGVYSAVPAAEDPQDSFRDAWKEIITERFRAAAPARASSRVLTSGILAWEGSVATKLNGSNGVAALSLLAIGSAVVPVVTLTQDQATLGIYRDVIDQVMSSIRIVGPLSGRGPTSVALPGQVRIADLVGEWREGESSFVTYVDGTSGAYRGSSSMAYGKRSLLKANGTYSYTFNGLKDGRPYKQEGGGTFGFSGNLIVFEDQAQNQIKKYQIVGFERQPDGSTLMKLLPPEYDARPGNIMLYAEKWVRTPQPLSRD